MKRIYMLLGHAVGENYLSYLLKYEKESVEYLQHQYYV